MLNQPDFHDDETGSAGGRVPLLCWDVAHPLLNKRQELVSDLQMLAQMKAQFDWQIETDFKPLLADNSTVVVTDRSVRIVWVNNAFRYLTGYQPMEALGKSPAFLQGPLTNPRTKQMVRQKLAATQTVAFKMLNYQKGGIPYWCQITIQPLVNSQKQCTHFIAFEKEWFPSSRLS